ncbi:uncharacterized protein LOC130623145 [Hydractinia symbiolongicarpus]|uniref:uncharacterized protein LOC130623145 n=1 Tax=Hydractinia symbiolongicarpus TaxID=13093 RepID=UPI002549E05E|nr:uncharacterized protein LOC130623145 [Hydractinia symbiolongicarpus]
MLNLTKPTLLSKPLGKKQSNKTLEKVEFLLISGQFIDNIKACHSHLQNLVLADTNLENSDLPVDILIGANFYWSFLLAEVIRPRNGSGPVALESKLGYILSGECKIPSAVCNSLSSNFVETTVLKIASEVTEKQVSHDTISHLWENTKSTNTDIVKDFKESLEFKDNRYQFTADNNLYDEYKKISDYQLETGIVEIVLDHENLPSHGNVHYLPHRAVICEDISTTKVRVVFYASASDRSACIECITGFLADIEKAFFQISLHPSHRDFVRFLWFKEFTPGTNFDDLELVILRLCCALFGCTSSPFLHQATLK